MLRDIGMYLGETWKFNYPFLKWGYYTTPKNDYFVNMPQIMGFYDMNFSPPFPLSFEPIHMATVQAAKLLRKKHTSHDLIDLYTKWEGKAIDPHVINP